ncbi:MAG: pyridoxal-dependent decarboxylase, partial [Solirubrobacteraceae bacterium]
MELADSVTLDPHKWLYQPIECGSLLVRDGALLHRAFAIAPDYLKDTLVDREVNFADRGLALTRSSHAIKIWLSIGTFGLDAFRQAIERSLELALLAERHVRESPALELVSPASLGIITFRRTVAGASEEQIADVNAALVRAFEASGEGLVSSTRLRGRYAIRLCVMNHTSTAADVRRVLDFFARTPLPPPPAPTSPPALDPARADIGEGWLGPPQIEPATLARLGLFRGVGGDVLERVAGWGRELLVPAGGQLVRRWESARDFFVIVAGRADVERDGELLAQLGAGEFFGEIAALDWGAGYGYARTASVTAATPLRLLVLGTAHLGLLMRDVPAVARRVEA